MDQILLTCQGLGMESWVGGENFLGHPLYPASFLPSHKTPPPLTLDCTYRLNTFLWGRVNVRRQKHTRGGGSWLLVYVSTRAASEIEPREAKKEKEKSIGPTFFLLLLFGDHRENLFFSIKFKSQSARKCLTLQR